MADDKGHPLAEMASPVNLIGLVGFLVAAAGVIALLGSPDTHKIFQAWADDDVMIGTVGTWVMAHVSAQGLLPPLPAKWNTGLYPFYVPAGVILGFVAGILCKKVAAFFLIKPRTSVFEDPANDVRHYGMESPELTHLEFMLPVCPSYDMDRLSMDVYLNQTDLASPSVPASEIDQ